MKAHYSLSPHLEDSMSGSSDSDHSLRYRSVTDVYLGPALLSDVVDDLSTLAYDGSHLLATGQTSQSQVDTGHISRQLELSTHLSWSLLWVREGWVMVGFVGISLEQRMDLIW